MKLDRACSAVQCCAVLCRACCAMLCPAVSYSVLLWLQCPPVHPLLPGRLTLAPLPSPATEALRTSRDNEQRALEAERELERERQRATEQARAWESEKAGLQGRLDQVTKEHEGASTEGASFPTPRPACLTHTHADFRASLPPLTTMEQLDATRVELMRAVKKLRHVEEASEVRAPLTQLTPVC